MILIGLDNVGKTDIVKTFLSILPPEVVERVRAEMKSAYGVRPYSVRTFIKNKQIELILQDTLTFDDPDMTGSYL